VAEIPSRRSLGVFPAVINPHHPLPAEKSEFDGRVGKLRTYLRFNPAEKVVALGNASIARLHRGRVYLAAGTGWIYTKDGVRELTLGEPVELRDLSP
jgi:dipeptidase E